MRERLPTPSPALHNVLPPPCQTGLAFYDGLSEESRTANVLRYSGPVTRDQYERLYGRPAGRATATVHITVDREYLLARIGELLLPSRIAKDDLIAVENALRRAGHYVSARLFSRSIERLAPLWEVSRDK